MALNFQQLTEQNLQEFMGGIERVFGPEGATGIIGVKIEMRCRPGFNPNTSFRFSQNGGKRPDWSKQYDLTVREILRTAEYTTVYFTGFPITHQSFWANPEHPIKFAFDKTGLYLRDEKIHGTTEFPEETYFARIVLP